MRGATGGHLRRIAAAALLILPAAGCTDGGDPDPPPGPSAPASTTPRTDQVGAQDDDFPTTPQEYAERAVAAWAAPDLIRLADLATPDVHEQLVQLPGPPDLTWAFIRCQDGAGIATTECAFHNLEGDRLVLTVDRRLLGGARAATAVDFQVTAYPDDPQEYLAEFVAAWQDGNLARMDRLAAPAVVAAFQQLPPAAEPEYRVGEPAGELVPVVVTIPEGELATELSTALLGQPQAIRTAQLIPATG